MNQTNTYQQWLLAKGVSLRALGLAEVALGRADALHAIEILRPLSVPVLGGDVYYVSEGRVEQSFANWHTERQPDESRVDYSNRSCRDSRKYIDGFPHRPDVTPVFVLVVSR